MWNKVRKFMNSPIGKILGVTFAPLGSTYLATDFIIKSLKEKDDLDKQIAFQEKTNETNLNFAKEQFSYNKYLNENQYKIHAADAQSVGINPIAMHGGSLVTGSFSAGQQAPDLALGSRASARASLIGTLINAGTSLKNVSASNRTSKDVAKINAYSAENVEKARIKSNEKLEEQRLDNEMQIAVMKNITDTERNKIAQVANTIREKEVNNARELQEFRNNLEQIKILLTDENDKKHLESELKKIDDEIKNNGFKRGIERSKEIRGWLNTVFDAGKTLLRFGL